MDPEPAAPGGSDPITPAAGSDPNPGAFDPDAFMSKLLGEFDKRTNAMDKKFNKFLETQKKPDAAPKAGDPAPGGDPQVDAPPLVDPALKGDAKALAEMNAKLHAMSRTLETVTRESEDRKRTAEEETSKRMEGERVSAFDLAIQDIPFADAKSRQTFRKAYLADVVRDEEGNLVAQTEKGPMAIKEYLIAEAQAQPSLMAKEGHSGGGANSGKKNFGANKIDIFTMTQAEIGKLDPKVRESLLVEAAAALAVPR